MTSRFPCGTSIHAGFACFEGGSNYKGGCTVTLLWNRLPIHDVESRGYMDWYNTATATSCVPCELRNKAGKDRYFKEMNATDGAHDVDACAITSKDMNANHVICTHFSCAGTETSGKKKNVTQKTSFQGKNKRKPKDKKTNTLSELPTSYHLEQGTPPASQTQTLKQSCVCQVVPVLGGSFIGSLKNRLFLPPSLPSSRRAMVP